ncbi:MAG: gliding motility-associated C-terminal domain-containing protein, partial [Flavobacteriia bacterium]|nr:gliding motility-associated C-terminal domain-containing protein [Flavobacteriia bacterium]
TVDITPTITINSGTICYGQSFTLNPSGAATYTFSGGTAVVSPTISSNYTITGSSAGGCINTTPAISTVVVNSLPNLTVSASNTVVCAGSSVTLSGSGASTYTWTGGVINNTAFIATSSSVYTLSATDANSCDNTATLSLIVNPLPTLAVVSTNTLGCNNETFTLTVSGANTYTWNTGANSLTISITPSTTTVYTVNGTDANGCTSVFNYTQLTTSCGGSISVNHYPSDVSCRGKNDARIVIQAAPDYTNYVGIDYKYLWQPSEVCKDDKCNTVENLKAGTYTVDIVISSTITNTYSRQDTIRRVISILDEKAPCDLNIYTGVTPNNDAINDTWQIENIELYPKNKVTIFDRWGTLVYEVSGYSNNSTKSWPNKAQLDFLNSSTYFYIIDLGDGGKPIKGWIELIRN